jgi:hypothetical protein
VPPSALVQDVPYPTWDGITNADLVSYAIEQQLIIQQCNNDKRLIREFINE